MCGGSHHGFGNRFLLLLVLLIHDRDGIHDTFHGEGFLNGQFRQDFAIQFQSNMTHDANKFGIPPGILPDGGPDP